MFCFHCLKFIVFLYFTCDFFFDSCFYVEAGCLIFKYLGILQILFGCSFLIHLMVRKHTQYDFCPLFAETCFMVQYIVGLVNVLRVVWGNVPPSSVG